MAQRQLKSTRSRTRRRGAQSGAALLFALVIVIIVTMMIAGVWNFVTSNVALAQAGQDRSHSIHIVESAINFQLNRMARTLPPGIGATTGYLTYTDFQNSNPYTTPPGNSTPSGKQVAFPADDCGNTSDHNCYVEGVVDSVTTYLTTNKETWSPPNDFYLIAVAHDPVSGVQRQVLFNGVATLLEDPYTLFGIQSLNFQGGPNTSCQLDSGYIGTGGWFANTTYPGQLTYDKTKNAPTEQTSGNFRGLTLHPNTKMTPDITQWPSSWDYASQEDRFVWPTIAAVFQYGFGQSPDSFKPNPLLPTTQMDYLDDTGKWKPFSQTPDKLTNAEFNFSSKYRTIRLVAKPSGPNVSNVFYFKRIDMQNTDTLVLDYSDTTLYAPAIRILLNNSASGGNMTVTSLAYLKSPTKTPIVWFNNTQDNLIFKPEFAGKDPLKNFGPQAIGKAAFPEAQIYQYSRTIRGLIYSPEKDAKIVGNKDYPQPLQVNSIIASNLTLDYSQGNIEVKRDNPEPLYDKHRFVLYYRIGDQYGETKPGDTIGNQSLPDPYNIGTFHQ